MEIIDLEIDHFNRHLFWDWSVGNMDYYIRYKLRYDSFKFDEFWIIRNMIEGIRL